MRFLFSSGESRPCSWRTKSTDLPVNHHSSITSYRRLSPLTCVPRHCNLSLPMVPFLLAFTFTTIQRWVTTRGFTGGVIVVFALLFACGLGLPLPEDIPLIISGAF